MLTRPWRREAVGVSLHHVQSPRDAHYPSHPPRRKLAAGDHYMNHRNSRSRKRSTRTPCLAGPSKNAPPGFNSRHIGRTASRQSTRGGLVPRLRLAGVGLYGLLMENRCKFSVNVHYCNADLASAGCRNGNIWRHKAVPAGARVRIVDAGNLANRRLAFVACRAPGRYLPPPGIRPTMPRPFCR